MAKRRLEARIAALERSLADIRVRAVEATEFRLVDKTGTIRAVLEMTRAGPRLAMTHTDGTIALELTLAPDGPGLRLADEEGQTRLFLGATRDAARIGLADAAGAQRAYLGVSPSGQPTLTMYDGKQKEVWSAPDQD